MILRATFDIEILYIYYFIYTAYTVCLWIMLHVKFDVCINQYVCLKFIVLKNCMISGNGSQQLRNTVINLSSICIGRYSLEKSVMILDQNKLKC